MINVIFNQFDYEISQRKQEMWDRYLKVIQWGRRNPVKFMELIFGLSFTDHQRYVLLSTWNTRFAVWLMSRNSGKSLALDTPIYVKNKGFYQKRTVGDLGLGDEIYDNTGSLTKVIHLNPVIFADCYEIEFSDGEIIKCNGEHLWEFYYIDKEFKKQKELLETEEWYQEMQRTDKKLYCAGYNLILREETKKEVKDIRKTNQKVAMRCITVSNDTGLFLCGDKMTVTHNSYLSAPYMMARSILIPNHKSYIMCPSGSQAKQTFMKIEDLSKGKIASARGSTGVFLGELVRANAGVDAFVHDKLSYHCELYNGSTITTLNSIAKNAVGIRSNLNFYDEAGE